MLKLDGSNLCGKFCFKTRAHSFKGFVKCRGSIFLRICCKTFTYKANSTRIQLFHNHLVLRFFSFFTSAFLRKCTRKTGTPNQIWKMPLPVDRGFRMSHQAAVVVALGVQAHAVTMHGTLHGIDPSATHRSWQWELNHFELLQYLRLDSDQPRPRIWKECRNCGETYLAFIKGF